MKRNMTGGCDARGVGHGGGPVDQVGHEGGFNLRAPDAFDDRQRCRFR